MRANQVACVVGFLFAVAPCFPQGVSYELAQASSSRVSKADFSLSTRPDRLPRNYDRYVSNRVSGYALSPLIITNYRTQTPVILGPVKQYSDLEYSRLVLSTMNVGQVQPGTSRIETRSVLEPEEGEDGATRYKMAEARVADVLDRCVLLLDTGEELRLRGVRVFSERDSNIVYRYYVRDAMRRIRALTQGNPIFIVFDEPVRDGDGNLLGTVYLRDGTELNRILLQEGLGYVEPRDFLENRDLAEQHASEQIARESKVGIWSR